MNMSFLFRDSEARNGRLNICVCRTFGLTQTKVE